MPTRNNDPTATSYSAIHGYVTAINFFELGTATKEPFEICVSLAFGQDKFVFILSFRPAQPYHLGFSHYLRSFAFSSFRLSNHSHPELS